MKHEWKQLTVRIPQELYPSLVYLADVLERSISAQAGWILQQQLKKVEIPNKKSAKIYDF